MSQPIPDGHLPAVPTPAALSPAAAAVARDLAAAREFAAALGAGGLPEIRFPVSASLSPLVFAKLEQARRRLGDELGRPVDIAGLLDTLLDQFLATVAADVAGSDGNPPGRKRVDASIYRVVRYESGRRGDPLLDART